MSRKRCGNETETNGAERPLEITQEMVRMAKFWSLAGRFAEEFPQYEASATAAVKFVRGEQQRMAGHTKTRPTCWRRHPDVQRLVLMIFERYGAVPC